MRPESEVLNLAGLVFRDLRRANMLGPTTRGRIQEGILVRKIVKAAFRDDLQDRQHLVAENADGQLATWNKLLDQEFAIVLGGIRHGCVNLPFIPDDMHPNG